MSTIKRTCTVGLNNKHRKHSHGQIKRRDANYETTPCYLSVKLTSAVLDSQSRS